MNYHPNNKGFTKLKVKSKDIHKIFPKRKLSYLREFSLGYNPLGCKFMLLEDYNWKARVVYTLALPFLCLISLIDLKEIIQDYFSLFKTLEKGKYSSDTIYPKYSKQRGWNSNYWSACQELYLDSKRRL